MPNLCTGAYPQAHREFILQEHLATCYSSSHPFYSPLISLLKPSFYMAWLNSLLPLKFLHSKALHATKLKCCLLHKVLLIFQPEKYLPFYFPQHFTYPLFKPFRYLRYPHLTMKVLKAIKIELLLVFFFITHQTIPFVLPSNVPNAPINPSLSLHSKVLMIDNFVLSSSFSSNWNGHCSFYLDHLMNN